MTQLIPAGKSKATPCPQCGAKWPIVQALYEIVGTRRKLVNCCTRCGISGEIVPRCLEQSAGKQCTKPLGHEGAHE